MSASSLIELCYQVYESNPWHFLVEALCLSIIVYLLTQRSYKKEAPLTEKEIDEMVHEWRPEPLYPNTPTREPVLVEGSVGPHIKVGGRDVLNFSFTDFLGLSHDEQIKSRSLEAIDKYGCGSCGPRGFYGTFDVHLELEDKLAKFIGHDKAIIYSAEIATSASTIPAFSSAGDLIVCDEGVGYSLQEGCRMSKSEVVLFKHNDMRDLEATLDRISQREAAAKKKILRRKFLIVEAVSERYGDIAPLQRIVDLKQQHKFRLILDESYSIGVLGKTGRGLTEHTGIKVSEVDLITGSFSNSFAACGGFCSGSAIAIDHQRLGGAGYVFSAASPPYLCVATIAALETIQRDQTQLTVLKKRAQQLRSGLERVSEKVLFVKVLGCDESPIVTLSLPNEPESRPLAETLHAKLLEAGLAVSLLHPCVNDRMLIFGVRLTVTAAHSEADVTSAVDVVARVLPQVLTKSG